MSARKISLFGRLRHTPPSIISSAGTRPSARSVRPRSASDSRSVVKPSTNSDQISATTRTASFEGGEFFEMAEYRAIRAHLLRTVNQDGGWAE
jgi:hypothetical protein